MGQSLRILHRGLCQSHLRAILGQLGPGHKDLFARLFARVTFRNWPFGLPGCIRQAPYPLFARQLFDLLDDLTHAP